MVPSRWFSREGPFAGARYALESASDPLRRCVTRVRASLAQFVFRRLWGLRFADLPALMDALQHRAKKHRHRQRATGSWQLAAGSRSESVHVPAAAARRAPPLMLKAKRPPCTVYGVRRTEDGGRVVALRLQQLPAGTPSSVCSVLSEAHRRTKKKHGGRDREASGLESRKKRQCSRTLSELAS
jgi:hypothetical protein